MFLKNQYFVDEISDNSSNYLFDTIVRKPLEWCWWMLHARLPWANAILEISSWGTFSLFFLHFSFTYKWFYKSTCQNLFDFEGNSIFHFLDIYLDWPIICKCFIIFDDIFKIILNIWSRKGPRQQFKFSIPWWLLQFTFIVFIQLFSFFSGIVGTKFR